MILLLGGTSEARQLAGKLAQAGTPALVSLAGAVRRPAPQALPTRIGGFGGEAPFRAFLRREGITAVLDATHPFATRITERTARVCADLALPHAVLRRPGWHPGPADRWLRIGAEQQAAEHVPAGSRVFLATGRQSLPRYAGLSECHLTLRVIDPPEGEFPFPDGAYHVARPPFTVESEIALFQRLKIDWLIAKDAGGEGGYAKLAAARALSLPVLLIDRPPLPPGVTCLPDTGAALAWVQAQ